MKSPNLVLDAGLPWPLNHCKALLLFNKGEAVSQSRHKGHLFAWSPGDRQYQVLSVCLWLSGLQTFVINFTLMKMGFVPHVEYLEDPAVYKLLSQEELQRIKNKN